MKFVMCIVLAFAVSPAVADTPKQELTAAEAKAWIGLFDKIVDAVVANRTDCNTMAGDLNAIITANQDTIRVVREAKAKGKKLPASAAQHLQDRMRRMLGALDKCGRDERVAGAFERINIGGR